jgi:hypothetical protein
MRVSMRLLSMMRNDESGHEAPIHDESGHNDERVSPLVKQR